MSICYLNIEKGNEIMWCLSSMIVPKNSTLILRHKKTISANYDDKIVVSWNGIWKFYMGRLLYVRFVLYTQVIRISGIFQCGFFFA